MDECLDDIEGSDCDDSSPDGLKLSSVAASPMPNVFDDAIEQWEQASDELKPAKIAPEPASSDENPVFDIDWKECLTFQMPNMDKDMDGAIDSLKLIVNQFKM